MNLGKGLKTKKMNVPRPLGRGIQLSLLPKVRAGGERPLSRTFRVDMLQYVNSGIVPTLKRLLPLIVVLMFFGCGMYENLELAYNHGGHTFFNQGFFSIVAKNIRDTGFLKTKFGQPDKVDENGRVTGYYVLHPPLISLILAASFSLLIPHGVSMNAAAVIVPSIFSLGALAIIYLIADNLGGPYVAFASTAIMGFTPMFRSYSQLVCHEPLATFFILGIVYTYMLMRQTNKPIHRHMMFGLIMTGTFVAWPIYYLIPLIAAHCLIYGKTGRLKLACQLFAVGAIMFSLFIAHIYLLEGDYALNKLKNAERFRAGFDNYRMTLNLEQNINTFQYSILKGDVRKGNTDIIMYGCVIFLLNLIHGLYKRRDTSRESYIIMLILVGAIHNFLWPVGVGVHNYWSYYLTPGLTLAAVFAVDSLLKEEDRTYQKVMIWSIIILFYIVNSRYFLGDRPDGSLFSTLLKPVKYT